MTGLSLEQWLWDLNLDDLTTECKHWLTIALLQRALQWTKNLSICFLFLNNGRRFRFESWVEAQLCGFEVWLIVEIAHHACSATFGSSRLLLTLLSSLIAYTHCTSRSILLKVRRHADKAKRVRNSCSCNWPGDMVARMRSLLPTWSTLLEFYVFIFLSNVSNYRVGNCSFPYFISLSG